jgi:hypothetical protein
MSESISLCKIIKYVENGIALIKAFYIITDYWSGFYESGRFK